MAQLQQNLTPWKNDSFIEQLQVVAQNVEEILNHILPPPTTRLHEAMRYSVLGGGKRLRSLLAWATAQLYDVSPQDVLRTAAALELIQAYSLVHDDLPCMDNADLRRGKPSCHRAYGETTAVLVGDALIPLAFQTLSSLKVSAGVKIELIEGLAKIAGSFGLVAGQMMDLGQEKPLSNYEDLIEQQRLKTGVFFGFAAEAGAILGNASAHERQALKSYGLFLGKAFQMIDDWLDGCGNEDIIGKPCGQDAVKLTFLSLLGSANLYKEAETAVQDAIMELSPFQERVTLLKEAALYTLHRKR